MWAANLENELRVSGDISPLKELDLSNLKNLDIHDPDSIASTSVLGFKTNSITIPDPFLRQKLLEYLDKIPQAVISAPIRQIIRNSLESRVENLTDIELSVTKSFLQHVFTPQISSTLGLSKADLEKIETVLSHKTDNINQFTENLTNNLKYYIEQQYPGSPSEKVFRDKAYLINSQNIEVEYIINTLFYNNELNNTMSDTELAAKILSYVQTNYKYTSDQPMKDHWQSIEETVAKGQGDCEDLAILQASLLMCALEKKGYSKDQVREMVKLSAGYLVDPAGNRLGHMVVKFTT
ncbi:transglutaminase domain-containing protein, partial [Candidatus Margulisiibacteriota bacterium]